MILGNLSSQKRVQTVIANMSAGALILFGPEGVGKKSFLWHWLKKTDFDYFFLNTQKNYGIELARSLKSISYRSHQKKTILVIDDAHKLTRPAQNALLKSLEEPSTNLIFVLLTHKLGSILPTIKSRSFLIPFTALSLAETKEALSQAKVDLAEPILLELYPGQPGKIISFSQRKSFRKLSQFFLAPEKEKKLSLLEEISKEFSLAEILEIWLMLLRKELWQFLPTKRKINFCRQLLDLWSESESYYLPLNPNLQLTNLILAY